jgi:hypothetical protein
VIGPQLHSATSMPRLNGPYGREARSELAALTATPLAQKEAQKAAQSVRSYEAMKLELAAARSASDPAVSIPDTPIEGNA